MDLYQQEPEVRLLGAVLGRLGNRVVIDVGAERGGFVEAVLHAGGESVHAIEPHPGNVAALRARFGSDSRVTVHACAASDVDGSAKLRVCRDRAGDVVSSGHTLLRETPGHGALVWAEEVTVTSRSLASMVADRHLPQEAAILKIDTEGNDFRVVRGMGELKCDIVMVEHWDDLPAGLGICPWTTELMSGELAPRGFSHFVLVLHRHDTVAVKWDDGRVPRGFMGNLIFIHDAVLERLVPALIDFASWASDAASSRVVELSQEGIAQQSAIEALTVAAQQRLRLINVHKDALTATADRLAAAEGELEAVRRAAAETAAIEHALAQQRATLEQQGAMIAESLAQQRATLEQQGAMIAELQRELESGRRLRGVGGAARRVGTRVKQLSSPRLGTLRHHAPQPLEVPASYLDVRAPQPPPRISIVTPSFEQGIYIERTLRSVLVQRYPALEYIVIDAGSSDGTVAALQRNDGALTHWESTPNISQARALNLGFARASGEIMAALSSDDLLLPGSLPYVASYLASHPDVDVVYGHRLTIDADDRQLGAWILPPHDDEMLTLGDYVPQETLFWRRSLWERIGGHADEALEYALDWELLLRMRDAGARFVRLPRFIGARRLHDGQKTVRLLETAEAECERLRASCHGRPVPQEEAVARLAPYLRRHVLYHTAYRVAARLPGRRIDVARLVRPS